MRAWRTITWSVLMLFFFDHVALAFWIIMLIVFILFDMADLGQRTPVLHIGGDDE